MKDIPNLLKLSGDEYYMHLAIKESMNAHNLGEVPVGAIAVYKDEVVAKSYNQIEILKDATAHAEMLLITQAAAFLKDWRLNEVTIYVTKEPCSMCAGAMVNSRLGRLVFGMKDSKYGAAGSALNITNFKGSLHQVNVTGGVLEKECLEVFQNFFRNLRNRKDVEC